MKVVYASKDAAPESIRDALTEEGGKFTFDLGDSAEGVKPQADFDNVDRALKAERKDHGKTKGILQEVTKKFDGIDDPDKARELLSNPVRVSAGDDELKNRIEAATKPLLEKVDTITKLYNDEKLAREKVQEDLREKGIDDQIWKAAEPLFHEGARDAVILKARKLLRKNENGEVEPYREDGQPIYSQRDATRLASLEELVQDVLFKDPATKFMQKPSGGANVNGGGGSRPTQGKFALTTAQMRDHGLYSRTKEAAAKEGQQVQLID